MKQELWVATGNMGKVNDFKTMLPNIEIKSLFDLPEMIDIPENEDTFEGNSIAKAKALYEIVQQPVLADDSGLEIIKMNGFPGVHSARWFLPERLDWIQVNELLLEKLSEAGLENPEDRIAQFVTVLTYYDGKDSKNFKGVLEGSISESLKGKKGFGYSPIFIPSGQNLTQAEMTDNQRQSNNHRKIATDKFLKWFNEKG